MILQEYSIITNIIVQNMQLFSDYELFDRYIKAIDCVMMQTQGSIVLIVHGSALRAQGYVSMCVFISS